MPSKKKTRLDDGYDMFRGDETSVDVGEGLDELGRYLRDAKPVATEDLLDWWKKAVRIFAIYLKQKD